MKPGSQCQSWLWKEYGYEGSLFRDFHLPAFVSESRSIVDSSWLFEQEWPIAVVLTAAAVALVVVVVVVVVMAAAE